MEQNVSVTIGDSKIDVFHETVEIVSCITRSCYVQQNDTETSVNIKTSVSYCKYVDDDEITDQIFIITLDRR